MREVCKSEESQYQHDDERKNNKPLARTYSVFERTPGTVNALPVVGGLACHKLVSGSGETALWPLWPCARTVAHACTSDQQTNLPWICRQTHGEEGDMAEVMRAGDQREYGSRSSPPDVVNSGVPFHIHQLTLIKYPSPRRPVGLLHSRIPMELTQLAEVSASWCIGCGFQLPTTLVT